ncbi:hypothetical protein HMPREF1049_1601 [Fusobacterium necrophorum subsp. funduliforme ATCC 51357]|uniref:Uncharacterized protein n=1 Tax=Fusobacterium gonidiaformans 3-1-5R TaxID=469605 RepID=E5BI21_9FUSO|nr:MULTISPECIES: hypothetical protein [Fusobacterium]EFS22144.1 hypothetical protein FSBG_01641 [Fusobacterium gonidiaformans 3-1-5R]EFS22927.1 hypothetical protein FSEG_00534 [Fusobacterium necrophorum D12]EIJ72414.1 hypothetical protein HMPREF1049_1601 [Fusobacterium necrophorum subsp. funduliforme ATCC 51357]
MILHYNMDGSIQMQLKFRGKVIEKYFSSQKEYVAFLQNFDSKI